jgi:hypothetical protein
MKYLSIEETYELFIKTFPDRRGHAERMIEAVSAIMNSMVEDIADKYGLDMIGMDMQETEFGGFLAGLELRDESSKWPQELKEFDPGADGEYWGG